MSRPEHILPADRFYDEVEAVKYTNNTRIINTQIELTERAIQILAIPEGKRAMILDIGCGSGLSGSVLTEHNHIWIGMDISKDMLQVAQENDCEGDLLFADMGQGLGFRPGVFDYAISISALQWICNAEKSSHNPHKRMKSFFSSLYKCLNIGARCCFQFYPDNPQQLDLITTAALENGFTGGLVVDYPHSAKAKKYYLFLQAGYTPESLAEAMSTMPQGKTEEDQLEDDEQISNFKKRSDIKKDRKNKHVNKKDWIQKKKDRQKRQGKETREDSKYSGRKRPGHGIY